MTNPTVSRLMASIDDLLLANGWTNIDELFNAIKPCCPSFLTNDAQRRQVFMRALDTLMVRGAVSYDRTLDGYIYGVQATPLD